MERIIIRTASGETIFSEEEYGDYNATYDAAVKYAVGLDDYSVNGEGWENQDRVGFQRDVEKLSGSQT